mgnify:CR=1 FL=1
MSSVYSVVTLASLQAPRSMLSQCDRLYRAARFSAWSATRGVGMVMGNMLRNTDT